MDDIVRQAIAKWPNVPHCYGWLALDARGGWRMRDEIAQAHDLPGDRIVHTALLAFINRNYLSDERGRWYFQNGPQRVYVNLAATPYIAQTDVQGALVLQTGEVLAALDAIWMTETGQLVVQAGAKVALVDDRDLTVCLDKMRIDDKPASDEALLAWLAQAGDELHFTYRGTAILVAPIDSNALAQRFGFVQRPQPDQ